MNTNSNAPLSPPSVSDTAPPGGDEGGTSFSYRLRQARKFRGFKQDELAKLVGLSPTTISMFERGHFQPRGDTIRRLSVALDVSADYLLGLSEFKYADGMLAVHSYTSSGASCVSSLGSEVSPDPSGVFIP